MSRQLHCFPLQLAKHSVDGSITLHRADMLKVLTDNLPPPPMFCAHFNKRLVSYAIRANSVILHFEDGSAAEADMLVGADGIKSATCATMYSTLAASETDEERKRLLMSRIQPSWSGTYAYRALVETEALLEAFPEHQAVMNPMIVHIQILRRTSARYNALSSAVFWKEQSL